MPRTGDARRLHLVRDDGDLGADERVDQRRLAGVGRADDGDEAAALVRRRAHGLAVVCAQSWTAAPRTPSRSEQRPRRRLLGRALGRTLARAPASCPLMRTSEVKCGAWSGPLRATSTYSRQREPLPWAHSCSADLASGSAVVCVSPALRSPTDGARRRAGLVEAAVDEDGAEQRLDCVGEDGALGAARRCPPRCRRGSDVRRCRASAPPWRRSRPRTSRL